MRSREGDVVYWTSIVNCRSEPGAPDVLLGSSSWLHDQKMGSGGRAWQQGLCGACLCVLPTFHFPMGQMRLLAGKWISLETILAVLESRECFSEKEHKCGEREGTSGDLARFCRVSKFTWGSSLWSRWRPKLSRTVLASPALTGGLMLWEGMS